MSALPPKSGHRWVHWPCPLCAKSGHSAPQQRTFLFGYRLPAPKAEMMMRALAAKSLEFFAKNPVDRIGAAATDGDEEACRSDQQHIFVTTTGSRITF